VSLSFLYSALRTKDVNYETALMAMLVWPEVKCSPRAICSGIRLTQIGPSTKENGKLSLPFSGGLKRTWLIGRESVQGLTKQYGPEQKIEKECEGIRPKNSSQDKRSYNGLLKNLRSPASAFNSVPGHQPYRRDRR
jgi:hypothetical protein